MVCGWMSLRLWICLIALTQPGLVLLCTLTRNPKRISVGLMEGLIGSNSSPKCCRNASRMV
ncbi:hypothetical protein LINGRAHAP2_LOCUS16524 [Linum grandiflorum]